MKRTILFVFTMFVLVFLANAQKKALANNPTVTAIKHTVSDSELGENNNSYGGTFQFIISKNAESIEVFTDEVLTQIEDNRLEKEENIIILSPNTKVRILSRDQITSSNFKPLTKLYTIE